jgi:regulatory protein YycI of two-component signal transduction system YycFG
MLEFTMDENGVTGFQQSYFSFNQANKVTVISAEEAVSYVEAENNVQRAKKPVISTVELSYINLVGNVEGGSLIFVPAWHIVVRDGDALSEYFVNGISREVQTLD